MIIQDYFVQQKKQQIIMKMLSSFNQKSKTENGQIRNRSTIVITDQSQEAHIPNKSFRYEQSKVAGLLSDQNSKKSFYPTKQYQNRDSQVDKQLSMTTNIEVGSQWNKNSLHSQYRTFLSENKKFQKPYSQCTRFADNLSQHKQLIRRGMFNAPLHKENFIQRKSNFLPNVSTSSKTNTLAYLNDTQHQNSRFKSITHSYFQNSKKAHKSLINMKIKQIYSKDAQKKLQKSRFDNTLSSHISQYNKLMSKERYQKKDQISLKNSINKILAMDLIKQKLQKKTLIPKVRKVYKFQ